MSIYGVCDNKCLRELNSIFSNSNLLANSSFQVWQRGTSFDASVSERYCADRWIRRNLTTAVLKIDTGVRITNTVSNAEAGIGQPLENIEKYLGKKITLSVKVNRVVGTWKLCMAKINNGAHLSGYDEKAVTITTAGVHTVTFTVPSTKSYKYYAIQLYSTVDASATIEVEYIKMEEGSVATANTRLAYGMELAECQRFYNVYPVIYSTRRKAWTNDSSKTLVPALPFPDMRTEPTLKVGSITTIAGADTGVTIASYRTAGNKYLTMITLSAELSEHDVFLNNVELNADIY